MSRNLATVSLLTLFALSMSDASAYEVRTSTWSGATTTLKVNLAIPTALPTHYDVLLNAESKVDANASAQRFDLVLDNDYVSDEDNGESELDFTTDSTLLCGSIACTWVLAHGDGTIDEADVYFDEDYDWTLTDYKWDSLAYDSGEKRPLINTALHEMLHSLGLKHENDCINILGNAWNVVSTNGDYTETVVSEDSTRGLIDTYGTNATAIKDLSVMHWKLDVASTGTSAYANHMRSQIYDSSGTELSQDSSYDELTYKAEPGDSIQVEMTLENRGTATQARNLGVYWSTNSTISTGDTLLFSSSATLAVNTPFEHMVTVTVPTGATPGTVYWVGAVIDSSGSLSESNESNNAAYIAAIEIQ